MLLVSAMRRLDIPRRLFAQPRAQSGAYALEYALVFPLFFLLTYGALALAIVMFIRVDLQHAAEEGARAALRYQTSAGARLTSAVTEARMQTKWMPVAPTVVADICAAGAICAPTSTPSAPGASCGNTLDTACRIMVVASYNYAANPVVPSLPGFGLILPATLSANASVLVDAKTLNP